MLTHIIDLEEIFYGIVYEEQCDASIDCIFSDYLETNKQIPDAVIVAYHHDFDITAIRLVPYALTKVKQRFAELGVNKLYVLLDYVMQSHHDIVKEFDITYIHSNLMFMDYYNPDRIEPTTHHITNKRCLILPGQLARLGRIGLLAALWERRILSHDNVVLSIAQSQLLDSNLTELQSLSGELTSSQFNMFIRNLKDISTDFFDDYTDMKLNQGLYESNRSVYTRSLYNHCDLATAKYADTKFTVVMETSFVDNPEWHSEKIWRTILNKHAFVMASNPGTLQSLANLGFKTFEKYMVEPLYDSIVDHTTRLAAIATNIKGFLELPFDQQSELQQDIEHNYARVTELIQSNYDQLARLFTATNVSFETNADMVTLTSSNRLTAYNDTTRQIELRNKNNLLEIKIRKDKHWNQAYSDIRGADWPDTCPWDEIELLPDWIQQEINVMYTQIMEKS